MSGQSQSRASRANGAWLAAVVSFSLLFFGFISLLVLGCSDDEPVAPSVARAPWPVGDLLDVSVPASDQACVVAEEGRIYWTRDGGQSWREAHVPAVGPLRGVSMADEETGWAFGPGVILKTVDGGARWQRQRLPGRAATFDLRAIAAIDRERAIAVGRSGLTMRTIDGGALWQAGSVDGSDAEGAPSELVEIACMRDRSGHCWSAGPDLRFTANAGASWRGVPIEESLGFEPIEFRFGQVEIRAEAARRLRQRVRQRDPRAVLHWRIDAGLSEEEVDRIENEMGPSALFDLVDARVEEVRLLLEASGVGASGIESNALIPWDYEDLLDEDPDFLERYWATRIELGPRALVKTYEETAMSVVAVDARGRGVAFGRSGRGLAARSAIGRWTPISVEMSDVPLAVAAVGDGFSAIGLKGGLWKSGDARKGWQAIRGPVHAEGLSALAFAPDGKMGLAVGAAGRILHSQDGGASWSERLGPAQEDQLSLR